MNGRWFQSCRGECHIFIAAYSVSDACRICEELSGCSHGWRREIDVYFSKGCWGNSMTGITPERGAWIRKNYHTKPERVL